MELKKLNSIQKNYIDTACAQLYELRNRREIANASIVLSHLASKYDFKLKQDSINKFIRIFNQNKYDNKYLKKINTHGLYKISNDCSKILNLKKYSDSLITHLIDRIETEPHELALKIMIPLIECIFDNNFSKTINDKIKIYLNLEGGIDIDASEYSWEEGAYKPHFRIVEDIYQKSRNHNKSVTYDIFSPYIEAAINIYTSPINEENENKESIEEENLENLHKFADSLIKLGVDETYFDSIANWYYRKSKDFIEFHCNNESINVDEQISLIDFLVASDIDFNENDFDIQLITDIWISIIHENKYLEETFSFIVNHINSISKESQSELAINQIFNLISVLLNNDVFVNKQNLINAIFENIDFISGDYFYNSKAFSYIKDFEKFIDNNIIINEIEKFYSFYLMNNPSVTQLEDEKQDLAFNYLFYFWGKFNDYKDLKLDPNNLCINYEDQNSVFHEANISSYSSIFRNKLEEYIKFIELDFVRIGESLNIKFYEHVVINRMDIKFLNRIGVIILNLLSDEKYIGTNFTNVEGNINSIYKDNSRADDLRIAAFELLINFSSDFETNSIINFNNEIVDFQEKFENENTIIKLINNIFDFIDNPNILREELNSFLNILKNLSSDLIANEEFEKRIYISLDYIFENADTSFKWEMLNSLINFMLENLNEISSDYQREYQRVFNKILKVYHRSFTKKLNKFAEENNITIYKKYKKFLKLW